MRDYFLTELLGIQGWYVNGKEITEEEGQQKPSSKPEQGCKEDP